MRKAQLFGLILIVLLAAGCSGTKAPVPTFSESGGKLKVAASFYPVYDTALAVGGDKVDVVNLVPTGVEAHSWEPSAGHIKLLNQAAVILYNGAGMENWVDKTIKSLDNKAVLTVETTKGFELLEGHEEADDHGHGHGHSEKAGETEWDPHIWLDPLGKAHQAEVVRDALIKADPANRAVYEANAAAYISQLKQLDADFRTGLANCQRKEFFTSHSAFSYLANRYGLEQHAIMGLAPDAEPKPKQLANIVKEAKEHGVKYIFFETLVSDKVANVVAKEIGAQTLVLNPLEGLTDADVAAGKTYLSEMRQNLANLKLALECK